EILFNQPLSARTGIKFHWMTGTAIWRDKATGDITQFMGVGATCNALELMWPTAAAQSPARWTRDEITRLRATGEIRPGIGKGPRAGKLKHRMDEAHKLGLVTHTMVRKAIENALGKGDKAWGLWPLSE